jgi:hypothetical protein
MSDHRPYGPPQGAIPLLDAMKQFLPAVMWEEHSRATEVRKNQPRRPRYFDMTVRQWQSAVDAKKSTSSTRSVREDLDQVWHEMLAAMKAKLEAGELTAFAQDEPSFGPWRAIPAASWRSLRIKNVAKGQATGSTVTLCDIFILRTALDDHVPTGVPGRPSKGIEFVKVEFERRKAAGENAASLAAEARWLANWYSQSFPARACPTAKTIENSIRPLFRQAKNRQT